MKIGLVLSGGMAKGAYQIGALRALAERFETAEIAYISAASVGAINGLAFSAGLLEEAAACWQSISQEGKRMFLTAVYKSEVLQQAMLLSERELSCERFYVPFFRLPQRDLIYRDLKAGDRAEAKRLLAASIAFPFMAKPVKIGQSSFLDGAVIDNIPVAPLASLDVDYIVCMYFDKYNYIFESEFYDRKIVKISFDDNETILSDSFWFSREQACRMMKRGYDKAKQVLDFVFFNGKEKEKVYARIKDLNALHPSKEFRVTGDVVVNGLNKLAKKVTKRRMEE